jgi:hypothetical protein
MGVEWTNGHMASKLNHKSQMEDRVSELGQLGKHAFMGSQKREEDHVGFPNLQLSL